MASYYTNTVISYTTVAAGVTVTEPTAATTPDLVDVDLQGGELVATWTDGAAADAVLYMVQDWVPAADAAGVELVAPSGGGDAFVKTIVFGKKLISIWKQ